MRLFLSFLISLLMLATSCGVARLQVPGARSIPETYAGQQEDSLTAAGIAWRDFFSDPQLIALIDTALKNNFDVLVAAQRVEQAKSSVVHSGGMLFPQVTAGGVAAVRRYGLYTMDGAGNSTTEMLPGLIVPTNLPDYLIGFTSSWEADISGKLRNRRKAAQARYLATQEGKNWLVTNIVASVATGYYGLLALQYELEVIGDNLAIQQNALNLVNAQKEAGVANQLAVLQLQNQLLETKALEAVVTQELVEAENELSLLVGRYPLPLRPNQGLMDIPLPSEIQSGVPSQLLRNRPDVREAELYMAAANADVRSARAAFYPTLAINGSAGFQAFRTNLLFTSPESFAFTLVGGLTAPLINRKALKAELQLTSAMAIESVLNYQKAVMIGYLEVNNELSRLRNLERLAGARNEQVALSVQSVDTSTELFRTGRATYIEVLMAQQNALNSRLAAVDTKRQQMISIANLYRALGGGWR